jgi:XTP/dITP diphosphohydrolase
MTPVGSVAPAPGTPAPDGAGAAVERLAGVMTALRAGCPWDAEQDHRSLVPYLIEETAEAVEAIEAGDDAAMREELGDLLLQVVFHAELGRERAAFTLADLADAVADKLIARHPYVFADADVPADPMVSWERRKKIEKARASAVDGIPEPLSTLARAGKAVARIRHHGVPIDLPAPPAGRPAADAVGEALLGLVAVAQAAGVDADQALRAAVRRLEERVRAAEA